VPIDRSSAQVFGSVAEAYERFRPEYPPEVVEWIGDRLDLEPGTTVVDLAAGTGKFTRSLVTTGARVVAVEPLPEMLAQLEAALPGVEALAGTAESIPLPDESVEAVTAAAAFHWFDTEPALREIHRVLKPGGALITVGNGRDLSDPLQAAVQEVVGRYLPTSDEMLGWLRIVEASPLFGRGEHFETGYEQWFDPDGLAERMGTVSYVARLPEDERAEVLVRIRAVGEAQPQTPFPFRYRTIVRLWPRL
jgi:ubiquinone/menaquinone biosynthesis C-methylase UbiE